jgi:nicotinamide-nucleotide amidase
MTTVEIVAVGNELLIGDVLDTNTYWLCKEITDLGGQMQRAVMVKDELEAIADELRAALGRRVDVVFTSGGLGPTADDMTMAAVAHAASIPLAENARALAFVKGQYEELAEKGFVSDAKLTEERRKMAILPLGALPLTNPVGSAPGVVLRIGETTIICLPGVPADLKGIFTTSLQPMLKELFSESAFIERMVLVDCGDESVLAPIIKSVAESHPSVYVKSRAGGFGP